MKILLVGAGGVGAAFAAIAARRDFFEQMVVADYDLGRAERAAEPADDRFAAAQVDASSAVLGRGVGTRARQHARDERRRPSLRHADLRRRVRRRGRRTSTWRCACRARTPSAPYSEVGVKLGDEQFAMAGEWEAAGRLALVRHRRRARTVRRVRPVRRRPPVLDIDELGIRDGANLTVEGYDFAPSFSIWTTIEECLNPPVDLGEGPGLVHDGAVQRAGGVRLPRGHRAGRVRERRARGGAPHAALGRRQAGDVQVRARRGVHRRAQDAAQARARPYREGAGRRMSRCPRATWWPPACPTPRRSATR